MAVSEDHASCWVHKDLTVTTEQIWVLLTAPNLGRRVEKTNVKYHLTLYEGGSA